MVFQNDRQRKGFFANLKILRENHDIRVRQKLAESIDKESKELAKIQQDLKAKQLHSQLQTAKQQQLMLQRQQLNSLKVQEKEARRMAAQFTAKGRAISFVRKEVGAAKKFATSDDTKKALKKIGKKLGL